jgi:hypothetical protein
MTAAGAMRRACSQFATAIALVNATGSRLAPARLSFPSPRKPIDPRMFNFVGRPTTTICAKAAAAKAERLRDEGKTVISIGWDDGGKTIDQVSPEPSNKD